MDEVIAHPAFLEDGVRRFAIANGIPWLFDMPADSAPSPPGCLLVTPPFALPTHIRANAVGQSYVRLNAGIYDPWSSLGAENEQSWNANDFVAFAVYPGEVAPYQSQGVQA